MSWVPLETSTHQDHVIAHVVGATVRGYFVFDETVYLLLDIGFVWNIYLDGEMGLVPHPTAVAELALGDEVRRQISADVDLLLAERSGNLSQMTRAHSSPIQTVQLFSHEFLRRIVIACEDDTLAIETSLETCEVKIMSEDNEALEGVAADEEQFVRERLKEELGHEPTQEEISEWLREHTESY